MFHHLTRAQAQAQGAGESRSIDRESACIQVSVIRLLRPCCLVFLLLTSLNYCSCTFKP